MKLLYEPSPDRDWHLRLSDHHVSREAELLDHLARIPGLSSATLEGDDVRLVTQEEGGFLSEPALLQAAETVGARVAAILLPESARISVLTMTASGGGWGAEKGVRAALDSLSDDINVLYPSGLYAAFTSDRDPASLKASLAAALEANKLTLGRFETWVRPRPGSVHAIDIDAKAVGWVNTRERVRATLLNLPGVLDVLIDGRVVFQMRPGAALDVADAKSALKEHSVEVSGDHAIDGFRFVPD